MTLGGFELYPPILLLGLGVGLGYGLLAAGLVLVFRSTSVVNLAHAQTGVLAAVVLAFLVGGWHVPYWVAFPTALGVGAAIAAVIELGAVRRLRRAPPVMSLVVTLGAGQVLTFLAVALHARAEVAVRFPQPPGFPELRAGALLVSPAFSALLVIGPATVGALVVFLRTPVGIALRAAAADASLARLTAVSPDRMSSLAWALSGGLSALTAMLLLPVLAPVAPVLSGPELLLRALAAAVVSRMQRLGVALAAGVALGVVEQVLFWNYPRSSVQQLLVASVVLVGLLALRRRPAAGVEAETRWRALQAWRPALPGSAAARRLRALCVLCGTLGVGVALLLVAVLPSTSAVVVPIVAAYAVVGLSVLVLTGLLGELSLGQFAVAAVGGLVSIRTTLATGNFFLGFTAAAAAGGAVMLAVGTPAVQRRRVALPAATLALAVATHLWLLPQPWALGSGIDPGRPVLGDLRFDTARSYAVLAVLLLLAAVVVVGGLTGGGTRRRLVAVRDDEVAARAFAVAPRRTSLLALSVAGALAGFAGAVYAHLLPVVEPSSFPVQASFAAVAIAALGGLGWVAGPVLGALWVVGIPSLAGDGDLLLASTALGWLVLVLYVPGGLAQLLAPVRALVVGARSTSPTPTSPDASPPARPEPLRLQVEDVSASFGDLQALEGVHLVVGAGETVALVGRNGAGKTTLLDVVAGYRPPGSGRVLLDDQEVTGAPAERVARLGVVRSFQSPRLFATLTVHEVLALAHERTSPTRAISELAGRRRAYRRNLDAAAETARTYGLTPYLDRYAYELSTGMRRIVELASVVARSPRLVLLDEPSAGVARAELPHLVELVRELRSTTGAGVLLVEHDTAVVVALADRAVALELGRVVASGAPVDVLRDAASAAGYRGSGIAPERYVRHPHASSHDA